MKRIMTLLTTGALLAAFSLSACHTAPKSEPERQALIDQSGVKIREYKAADPEIQSFFDTSYGYAVFPSVGSGAFGVGGSYGRGVVYEQRVAVGFADVTSVSVGLQVGGQGFSEIIFFQTKQVFDDFKSGKVSFTADANAVALEAGAAGQTNFRNGVAIFIKGQSGLMASAAIGGQNFKYAPF